MGRYNHHDTMYSAGAILWLPPKQDVPSQHLLAANTIDEGCFNHPVLILCSDSTHTEVVVLLVCFFSVLVNKLSLTRP
jgi:hypothetical protein